MKILNITKVKDLTLEKLSNIMKKSWANKGYCPDIIKVTKEQRKIIDKFNIKSETLSSEKIRKIDEKSFGTLRIVTVKK